MQTQPTTRIDQGAARHAPLKVALSAALLVGCVVALAGCRTFSQRGPVPDAVATCRQLSQQGLSAMQQGDWTQAEKLLAQALQTCPSNLEARRHYAEALWRRGSKNAAVTQLEAVLVTEHDDPTLHVRAGEMYLALEDYERAHRHAEQALGLNIELGSAWALRGRVHRAEGDTRQALADLHRALRYSPDDAGLLLAVAELYRASNQPQRALAALQALSDVYPPGEAPEEVHRLIGLAYQALGRHEDAAASLQAASLASRPNPALLFSQARADYVAGRPAEAAIKLSQALALDPQHAESRELLNRLQLAQQGAGAVRQ